MSLLERRMYRLNAVVSNRSLGKRRGKIKIVVASSNESWPSGLCDHRYESTHSEKATRTFDLEADQETRGFFISRLKNLPRKLSSGKSLSASGRLLMTARICRSH